MGPSTAGAGNLERLFGPAGPVILGDGALGTLLLDLVPVGGVPEYIQLSDPDRLAQVHADYRSAGAQWLQTNTFGANRPRLRRAGLDGLLNEVIAAAVEAARHAAGPLPVLGSVGPTGVGPEEWERAYQEAAALLAGAGVDGFVVETIVSLPEGLAAVRAAASTASGPVLACYTPGPDGGMYDGAAPEVAAEALVKAGACVVGINCGAGPETLFAPAARLAAAGIAPVLAAPSAGFPILADGQARYPVGPDAFARAAIQFRDAGVQLVAGCCGTTPDCIRAAARVLEASS